MVNREKVEVLLAYLVLIILMMKPIADMFYTTQIIDALMLGMMIGIATIYFLIRGTDETKMDLIPIIWFGLLVMSLVISGQNTAWITWIKVVSIFPFFYVGKKYPLDKSGMLLKGLQLSYMIVLLVNLVSLCIGYGYKVWAQDARTFCGVYYFKTDLALAMAQVILLFLSNYPIKWFHYVIVGLAMMVALMANSRIYMAIIMLLLMVCGFVAHRLEKRIQFKTIILIVLAIMIVAIAALVVIAHIPFFNNRNFISFRLDGSLQDILEYNLMSRNRIWADTLKLFFSNGSFRIIAGNGVTSRMAWYDAHSLYVSVLYKFGIIGIVLLIALLIWAWRTVQEVTDSRMYYLNMGFWIIFLIAGISYTTSEATQYTWLMAFFVGTSIKRRAALAE